ncbi:MAG: sugar phosphate isomerase/epimerase [Gemmatimonadaceae bacterium]|nr:sugar phosphate isomerase/epimerase [Gemmatimonadaceae bacterium]
MKRRHFLVTASAIAGSALFPRRAQAARLDRIGVQLYTVRSLMAADMDRTLALVAEIGYRDVEFAGLFGRKPSDVRRRLDALGLRAPSTHVGLEALEGDALARTIDEAHALGHETVILPWLPPATLRSVEGIDSYLPRFAAIGERCRAAGLRFAYHNHGAEVRPVDGVRPLDRWLGRTDPTVVAFQLDVYWTVLGGADPLDYFARFPRRFVSLHVKDSGGPPGHEMRDVGAGRIDWGAILRRRERAGVRHVFVEHDEPADPVRSIRASYQALAALDI